MSRVGESPLFAGSAAKPAPRPIESADLNPIGAAPTAYAASPIATSNGLRERGWSVEGAPIVEVAAADTAASLSAGFGVPVSVILEANGLTNTDQVRPGQRLVIPTYVRVDNPRPSLVAAMPAAPKAPPHGTPTTTLAAQAGESRHVVQSGDTLSTIASAYRVPASEIARLNGLAPDGGVQLGSTLRIPAGTSIAAAATPAPALVAPQQVAALEPANGATTLSDATPAIAQEAAVSRPIEPVGPDIEDDGGTGFRWPVHGRIITGFGKQADGARNDGINLAVPAGTPVRAAEDGTVIYAGNELEGYGNLVLVQHADDWVSAYAHNDNLKVKRGDKVQRGQTIAAVGKSGSVDTPQLHFELRRKSKPVDPLPHLSGA